MYELLVSGGKTVVWDGKDGLDACQRYADAHPGVSVSAWRQANRTNVVIPSPNLNNIIEPGHRDYGKPRKH
jgi:hypothetical protein